MAELKDNSDLSMQEIERSLQQVLDTQEDEDDFLNTNLFFNNGNSKSIQRVNGLKNGKHFKRTHEIFECDNESMGCDTEEYTPCINKEMILENINKIDSCSSEMADSKMQVSETPTSEIVQIEEETLKTQSVKDYDEFVEKIKGLTANFKSPNDIKNITKALKLKGIDVTKPVIRADFGSTQQLNQNEVSDLFTLFGSITDISCDDVSFTIFYDNIVSAYYAKTFLNGEFIPIVNSKVNIKFQFGEDNEFLKIDKTAIERERQAKREAGRGHHQKARSVHASQERDKKMTSDDPYVDTSQNLVSEPAPRYTSCKGSNVKFTCRYEIQIYNDREFQVARKLIGAKGSNMKKIIEECKQLGRQLEEQGYGPIKVQDLVKLRLRGKGSGFKEGPSNQESNDPLHLCISSKYSEIYDKACQLTENLLNSVYDHYYKFQMNKYGRAQKVYLKKLENIFGRKSSGSSNNSNSNTFTRAKHNRNESYGGDSQYDSQHNMGGMNHDGYQNYQNNGMEQCYDSYGYYDAHQTLLANQGPINFTKSNSCMSANPSFKSTKSGLGSNLRKSPNKNAPSFYPSRLKSKNQGPK